MTTDPKRSLFELEERVGGLRPSQKAFIFDPAMYSVIDGGWSSGKTYAICLKGLILSAIYPRNQGLIGRFSSKDLEDNVLPVFFDVCPPSWIKGYQKTRKVLTLKNGSIILFRHIHDADPKRRHITGMNLGWFGLDQMEELNITHWNTLLGRLRLPRAKKRFGFGNANPNGKDWIFNMFFREFQGFGEGEYFQTFTSRAGFGVATRAEENRKSNGGYVDDDFYDSLREQLDPKWIARYMDCSFEEFSGKVYGQYNQYSVHNIQPFPIPEHWPIVVGIDPGGSTPWGITVNAFDEIGNMITFAEFHKENVNCLTVANWIKSKVPWNSSRVKYVIDYENKVVMLELGELGIMCQPAIKKVLPGVIRFGGYVHVNLKNGLPPWYTQTQPHSNVEKFVKQGSPRWFVMNHCTNTRREHDNYIYDEKTGKPKKVNDHTPDTTRYVVMGQPPIAAGSSYNPRRALLRRIDPASAREARALDQIIQGLTNRQRGRGGAMEAMLDETPHGFNRQIRVPSRGRYDWD